MHMEQDKEISTMEWLDSQINHYPDSEEKRRVENLAQKIDLVRKGFLYPMNHSKDYVEEFMNHQEKFFELWSEFDIAIGRLKSTSVRETIERRRWIAAFVVSVLALVIAIVSIIISIGK